MIIITNTNTRQHLVEILQPAGNAQVRILKQQMSRSKELYHALNTPIKDLPTHQSLTNDPVFKRATLLQIIEGSIGKSGMESYFMKTSKGLYVGFIAIALDLKNDPVTVEDVKFFSFNLPPSEDENMIRRDVPALMDICLKRFPVVTWKALKTNKANAAYEIYRKKHKGKRDDLGDSWLYTCYGEVNDPCLKAGA